ncbi:MAG: alpha/beta hydrolase, partial [Thermoproteota archaeon]|nr:alpha/beta hydrolase [Thermoproteota archaeon]
MVLDHGYVDLKIQKTDVLGYSLGSFVAQQLTLTHPEKVNRLILLGASCGGKESIPPSPEVVKFFSELANKSKNNIPITPQELKTLLSLPLGSAWIKLHPNYLVTTYHLVTIPANAQLKDIVRIPSNTIIQQNNISQNWTATNWSGICEELTKVSSPTLIITGNHDNNVPTANSLIIAGKIPGAWLVQIK